MLPVLGSPRGSLATLVVVGALGVLAVVGVWATRDRARCEVPAVAIAQPAPVPSVVEAEAQLATAQRRLLIARLHARRDVVTVVRRAYGCVGLLDLERIELDGLRARRSLRDAPARPLAIEPATWHRLAEALTRSPVAADHRDADASTWYVFGDVEIPASSAAGAAIATALAPLAAQMQADQHAAYADTVVELTVERHGARARYRIDRARVARLDRTGWTPIAPGAELAAVDLLDAVLAAGVPRAAAVRGSGDVLQATVARAGRVQRLVAPYDVVAPLLAP